MSGLLSHDEHNGGENDHERYHAHDNQCAPGVVRHVARIPEVLSLASHLVTRFGTGARFICASSFSSIRSSIVSIFSSRPAMRSKIFSVCSSAFLLTA